MTEQISQNNLEDENILPEEKKEDGVKPVPPIPQKVSKVPHFAQQNHFGKGGGFNNFTNNKQRPGRAASRGR